MKPKICLMSFHIVSFSIKIAHRLPILCKDFQCFLQGFPSRLSKIHASPKKPEHLLLDNQSNVSFSDVIGIFVTFKEKITYFYHYSIPSHNAT